MPTCVGEAKAWQAFYATLLRERSKFGLNELLDARVQSTGIPTAFGEHALVRLVVASRGHLDEARRVGRAAKSQGATFDDRRIGRARNPLSSARQVGNCIRAYRAIRRT